MVVQVRLLGNLCVVGSVCRYCCEWAYNVLSPTAYQYVLYVHAYTTHTTIHMYAYNTHVRVLMHPLLQTAGVLRGDKSSWSEMCMLYNAYCAKLSNIGAMSSTEFLTVLRWALPRTHWAVAWSFCTGRLVFCLDLSRTCGYHTGAGVSVC